MVHPTPLILSRLWEEDGASTSQGAKAAPGEEASQGTALPSRNTVWSEPGTGKGLSSGTHQLNEETFKPRSVRLVM